MYEQSEGRYDLHEVLSAAESIADNLLANELGIDLEKASGVGVPCPKGSACDGGDGGGTDRCWRPKDKPGSLGCRKCVDSRGNEGMFSSNIVNALQDFGGMEYADALQFVAKQANVKPAGSDFTIDIPAIIENEKKKGSVSSPVPAESADACDVADTQQDGLPLCTSGDVELDGEQGEKVIASVAERKGCTPAEFQTMGGEAVRKKSKNGNTYCAVRFPLFHSTKEQTTCFYINDFKDNKGWIAKGNGSGVFANRIPEPGDTVYVTEGVKDAAKLTTFFSSSVCIGTNGPALPDIFGRWLKDCEVILVPDNDKSGVIAVSKTARSLGDGPRGLQVVDWSPVASKIDDKDGVREIALKVGNAEFYNLVANAVSVDDYTRESPVFSIIECHEENLAMDSASIAEVVGPRLFYNGDRLVKPVWAGGGRMKDHTSITLTSAVSAECQYEKVKTKIDGTVTRTRKNPPESLIRSLLECPELWEGIGMELTALQDAPAIAPSGSVVNVDGYDRETTTLFRMAPGAPEIPENPTAEDVEQSKAEINKWLDGVLFNSDTDKAAYIAYTLTAACRPFVDGPVPLFVFDANQKGTGKSELNNAASIVATGQKIGSQTLPRDKEEVRKTITAILALSPRCVSFDNVNHSIGCEALDTVITEDVFVSRILGKSEVNQFKVRTIFSVTANNVRLSTEGDLQRRVLPIRLFTAVEDPWDGVNTTCPTVYAKQHRWQLYRAAMVLIKDWINSGRPVSGDVWGSFREWSNTMRQVVIHAGYGDPCYGQKQWASGRDNSDEDYESLVQLVEAITESAGGRKPTASDLYNAKEPTNDVAVTRELAELVCGESKGFKSFSYSLARYVDRPSRFGVLRRHKRSHGRLWEYWIEPNNNGGKNE